MVAYLEKTDGNTDFHEIIDFLTRSSIHYALTVSPVVSTTFVEQFWMSAKSKKINNVRYITAKVAGKPVNILETSIRSDLFNDANGIDSLHNQAIFDAIQLIGYEGVDLHKDLAFDDLDDIVDDAMDYMETEDAYDEGRTSFVVLKEKESVEKGVSIEDQVSTVKLDEGTDKPKVSTDKPEVSTDKPKEVEVSTDKLDEGTAEPKDGTSDESTAPTTVFRDDETIAKFLVSMSQNKAKQKGVKIKDAKDSDRLRVTSTRSILTLKPLPKYL
ncbi:hypothetical protein Tco_0511891 [Tanacetum coccineum]